MELLRIGYSDSWDLSGVREHRLEGESIFPETGHSIPSTKGRSGPSSEAVDESIRVRRIAPGADCWVKFQSVGLLFALVPAASRAPGAGSTRAGPGLEPRSVRSRPELAELRASVGGPIAHTALRALSDRSAFYLRDGGTHAIPIGCRRLRAVVHVIDGSVGVLAL